jgi:hypothetical protein
MALDPASLSAFAATLSNRPAEEIREAKRRHILDSLVEFENQRRISRTMLIVMGIMCLFPLFLIAFIPAIRGYRTAIGALRGKILNALDTWKDDLGPDYQPLRDRAMK